jgi:hypothetical protein
VLAVNWLRHWRKRRALMALTIDDWRHIAWAHALLHTRLPVPYWPVENN